MWANAAGCPSSSWTSENVESVWKLIFANRLFGEKIMAEDLNVDGKTVRKILAEGLGMKKVLAKIMPPVLSDVRNQVQLGISTGLCHYLATINIFFGIDLLWVMNCGALNVIQK
jgi:dephospho-CoA kinase